MLLWLPGNPPPSQRLKGRGLCPASGRAGPDICFGDECKLQLLAGATAPPQGRLTAQGGCEAQLTWQGQTHSQETTTSQT